MCVAQLRLHEGSKDAATAVRRVDADEAEACSWKVAARDGEVEGERAGTAHDRAVRPGTVHPLERDLVGEAPHALLGRDHSEVLAERKDGRGEFVEVPNRSHLERHQNSSGQYGIRAVRKRAAARSIASARNSRTRSAA